MTAAGELRHVVSIQKVTEAQDPVTGAISDSWSNHAAGLRAAIVPLSGAEIVRSGVEKSATRVRITLRSNTQSRGITAKMRVLHGSTYYNIVEVIPDSTMAKWVTLMAEAGVRNV